MPGKSGKNEPEQVGRSQILRSLEGLACISEVVSLSCSVENTWEGVGVAAKPLKSFSVTQMKSEMMASGDPEERGTQRF